MDEHFIPQRTFKGMRQEQIYEIIKEKRSVSIDELASLLYSSPSTVRRDLALLENSGLIKRFHGGAVIADSLASEIAQELRENVNSEKKIAIANLVNYYLSDNISIFIDSSTTTRFLAPVLAKYSGITCYTNSIRTANELLSKTNVDVHLAGGRVVSNSSSTYGAQTVDFLNQYFVDYAFIACRGVSSVNGCTVVNDDHAVVKKTMMKNAKIRFLLCDSTKFESVFRVHFADFSDFDYFVTDQKPEGKLLRSITQAKCKLITFEDNTPVE